MAKFSKSNQPKRYGGGRPLDPNSKAGQKRAETARKEKEFEEQEFSKFENAESGYFDGFDFVNIFHAKFSKDKAVEILESDDCANVTTSLGHQIHVGADGITAYIMTETAKNGNAKKLVIFNRSVYIF